MESRKEIVVSNMPDEHTLGGQQQNKGTSFLGRFAGYAKQALKGVSLLAVGVLGYFSLKGAVAGKEKEENSVSEQTGLKTLAKITQESNRRELQLSLSDTSPYLQSKRQVGLNKEFRVNNYTVYDQMNPSIAALSSGNFIVTWQSDGQDGAKWDIYAQLLDPFANKIGSEILVNTHLRGDQTNPNVTPLRAGKFVVSWESFNQNSSGWYVYTQLFDASAKKIGTEFPLNTSTKYNQANSKLVFLNSGNFVLIWQNYIQDTLNDNIYGQLFDGAARKLGSQFLVNTYTNGFQYLSERGSSVAAFFGTGNFVVTWHSKQQAGLSWDVYGQLFTDTANKIGSEFQINTYSIGDQSQPAVLTLHNDNFIVTWKSAEHGSSVYAVYAQKFNSQGNKIGPEFRVSDSTAGNQLAPTISRFGVDKFIIMWTSLNEGPYGTVSKARLYSLNATQIGNPFYISQYSSQYPVMASNSAAGLAVWEYLGRDDWGFGIFGRSVKQTISVSNNHINRTYTQDQPYLFSDKPLTIDIFYNPNVNFTLTLSNKKAGTFKSITLPNVLSRFDVTKGQWQLYGELYGVNKLLTNLVYQPTLYFSKNFTITLSVHDGISHDYLSSFQMSGIPVDIAPTIVNNEVTIEAGKITLIRTGDLKASDVDNPASTLLFIVTGIKNGQFELKHQPNKAIARFSQSEIMNNNLQFRPDGSNNPPSYNITVSDGQLSSLPSEAQINFIAGKGLSRSATVGIVVTVALVSGAGLALGVGIWRHSATRKKAKQRAKSPLANKIYEKLNLKNVEDFKSVVGRIYVGIINQIEVAFKQQLNYEINTMATDALSEFADYIVQAIEQNVTIKSSTFHGAKLDWADVQSKLDRIVNDAKNMIEKDGWVPRQGKVTEKFNFNEEYEVKMVTKRQLREPLISNDSNLTHR